MEMQGRTIRKHVYKEERMVRDRREERQIAKIKEKKRNIVQRKGKKDRSQT